MQVSSVIPTNSNASVIKQEKFIQLPASLIKLVLSNLPPEECVKLIAVSKKWQAFIFDPTFLSNKDFKYLVGHILFNQPPRYISKPTNQIEWRPQENYWGDCHKRTRGKKTFSYSSNNYSTTSTFTIETYISEAAYKKNAGVVISTPNSYTSYSTDTGGNYYQYQHHTLPKVEDIFTFYLYSDSEVLIVGRKGGITLFDFEKNQVVLSTSVEKRFSCTAFSQGVLFIAPSDNSKPIQVFRKDNGLQMKEFSLAGDAAHFSAAHISAAGSLVFVHRKTNLLEAYEKSGDRFRLRWVKKELLADDWRKAVGNDKYTAVLCCKSFTLFYKTFRAIDLKVYQSKDGKEVFSKSFPDTGSSIVYSLILNNHHLIFQGRQHWEFFDLDARGREELPYKHKLSYQKDGITHNIDFYNDTFKYSTMPNNRLFIRRQNGHILQLGSSYIHQASKPIAQATQSNPTPVITKIQPKVLRKGFCAKLGSLILRVRKCFNAFLKVLFCKKTR